MSQEGLSPRTEVLCLFRLWVPHEDPDDALGMLLLLSNAGVDFPSFSFHPRVKDNNPKFPEEKVREGDSLYFL